MRHRSLAPRRSRLSPISPRLVGAAVSVALGACGSIASTPPDGAVIDPLTPDAKATVDAPDARIDPAPDAPDAHIDPLPAPNLVFVTSTRHDGDLGGLAGADAICNARAHAANLPGTYRAWLSTATASALSRLGSASGWVRPDGKLVARTRDDLAGDHLFYPPRLDELGHDAGTQLVRTATGAGGAMVAGSGTCGDYTSATDATWVAAGEASGGGWLFSAGFGSSCTDLTALYCFGIDHSNALPTPIATGRRAFATAGNWTPGTGLAGADALCQQEATAANLPGTFRALLANVGTSALSRFDTSGAPWVRPDGVQLAATADLSAAAFLDAPPAIDATGSGSYGNSGWWTGASTLAAPGTASTTCNGWTSASDTATGTLGQLGNSHLYELVGQFPNTACNNAMHLVCLAL
ncbi:MAG: hypothetical protein K8W52_29235 [Deltaproteobacteria bacterium]|nr:hypothetical protein [Deltaproteobacteria bacterium]